jgi:menaquinone-dependent protoporphyrinogen oxidase
MSRVLIVFASSFGQTRAIAEAIGARLRVRGHTVELADARSAAPLASPSDYDAVVLGSRVQFGKHAEEIVDFVRRHKAELVQRPTSFFSVSMAAAAGGADPAGYLGAFFAATTWRAPRAVAFAGALPYRRYGRVLRFVMKMISRRAGHATDTSKDHVYTDWSAVTAFADAIADDLVATVPTPWTHRPRAQA